MLMNSTNVKFLTCLTGIQNVLSVRESLLKKFGEFLKKYPENNMDYKLSEVGGSYVVEETQTGSIVYVSDDESNCRKMMKHLNLGGGFGGFTPKFFLQNNFSKKSEYSGSDD